MTLLLIAAFAAPACGDDDPDYKVEAVSPPDNPDRELPALGPPQGDHQVPDIGVEEGDAEQVSASGDSDAGECCPVRFAVADPYEGEDEAYALLRGTIAPLHTEEGVELTFADGEWSATACVPAASVGVYYYEFGLSTDTDGEYFVETRVNPYVETTEGPEGLANLWTSAADCASLDAQVHARTSD